MWCPHCKSEVSTSGSGDRGDLRCDACSELILRSTPSERSVREARDILARWSSESLLDQISALPAIPPIPGMPTEQETDTGPVESNVKRSLNAAPVADRAGAAESGAADCPDADSAEKQTESPEPGLVETNAESTSDADSASEVVTSSSGATCLEADYTAKKNTPESTADKPSADDEMEVVEQAESAAPSLPAPAGKIAAEPQEIHSEDSSSGANDEMPSSALKQHDAATGRQDQRAEAGEDSATQMHPHVRNVQKRSAQTRRSQHRRKIIDQSMEGSTPVNRKLRVDSPDNPNLAAENPESAANGSPGVRGNSSGSGRRFRVDGGERVQDTLSTSGSRERTQTPPRQRYIDEPHESALRGPHFYAGPPKRSNLTALTGQFLAYLGVLGLTVGTAIVIYGHFGGHAEYTPTGWLVTTVAQMMLFLGVINLVSGGIEQTNDDVSARINHLGEQLMRIEQVTEQALKGPKISPRRYASPGSTAEESSLETASIDARD